MRVYGAAGSAAAVARAAPRRVSAGGFSLADPEGTTAPRTATGPHAIASLDALIALQAVEDPSEKRKRSLKRGRSLLEALEALKVELLGGPAGGATLAKLRALAQAPQENSGDPGLDAVMAAIELRVAVELAKFRGRAA